MRKGKANNRHQNPKSVAKTQQNRVAAHGGSRGAALWEIMSQWVTDHRSQTITGKLSTPFTGKSAHEEDVSQLNHVTEQNLQPLHNQTHFSSDKWLPKEEGQAESQAVSTTSLPAYSVWYLFPNSSCFHLLAVNVPGLHRPVHCKSFYVLYKAFYSKSNWSFIKAEDPIHELLPIHTMPYSFN